MSGVEVLGLACNVLQIIDYASNTVTLCKNIYQGRSPSPDLKSHASDLESLSAQVQSHVQGLQSRTASERKLSDIGNKCNIAARALDEELQFLLGHQAKGNLAATLRLAVKTNWRKSRLERLQKSLAVYQNTMEAYLLANVCQKSDAIELQQRLEFEKFDQNFQHFVSQYAAGHTQLSPLVKAEFTSTNRHITKENARLEQAFNAHVTREMSENAKQRDIQAQKIVDDINQSTREFHIQDVTQSQRDRFLQSLKFPTMNERRNHVTESFEGTFEWIFHTAHTSEEESPSNDDSWHNESIIDTDLTSDSSNNVPIGYDSRDCRWDDFHDWLKSDSKIYWINGKPGSGKSTLVKFILSSPETQSALDAWSESALILSHFFWKPGTMLQKGIKGFLCSMLHQMLLAKSTVLDSILANSESYLHKDNESDWSVKELESLFMAVLTGFSLSVCLFLDGLDEASDKGGLKKLMGLVDHLRTISGLKMCLASRPEPRFQSWLGGYPQLRLQDLTKNDMIHYADKILSSFCRSEELFSHFIWDVREMLVGKAEGVFLWLCLAVKSIESGVENGDDEAELLQRLDLLPSDLSQLYADMWIRINGDIDIYRREASRYFNLIVEAKRIQRHLDDLGISISHWKRPISLFRAMAANSTSLHKLVIEEGSDPDVSTLESLCTKAQRAIEVRCAGLLQISKDILFGEAVEVWIGDYSEKLFDYAKLRVDFVHRTVYDFFTETEDGLRIRGHDLSSADELCIDLVKGFLIEARTCQARLGYSPMHIHPLSMVENARHTTQVQYLLRVCWKWYDQGYLQHDYRQPKDQSPCFLAAAAFPSCETLLVPMIEGAVKPSSLATEVLRDVVDSIDERLQYFDTGALEGYIAALLSLKGDPNQKGPSRGVFRRDTADGLEPYQTTFAWLLINAHYQDISYDAVWRLLPAFMSSEAHLDEPVPLVVRIALCDDENVRIIETQKFTTKSSRVETYPGRTLQVVLETTSRYFLSAIYNKYETFRLAPAMKSDLSHRNVIVSLFSQPIPLRVRFLLFGHSMIESLSDMAPFRLQNEARGRHMVALLEPGLDGGGPHRLSERNANLRSMTENIIQDILNGSSDFEQVSRPVEEYLADEQCGFRWIDHDKHIRSEENAMV